MSTSCVSSPWPKLALHEARRLLLAGGWFWPASAEEAPGEWDACQQITGLPGPPAPAPGRVLLVTVESNSASLWLLDIASFSAALPSARERDFSSPTYRYWELARRAVPRSLPVVTRALALEDLGRPRATLLVSQPIDRTRPVQPPTVLKGTSFGLAFALALASWGMACPLPEDFLASAAVDELGRTHPVDGLQQKMLPVVCFGRGITRILVSAAVDQSAAGRRGLPAGVHRPVPLEVPSLRHAVDLLFARSGTTGLTRLVEELLPVSADVVRRQEIVGDLFDLALGERSEMSDWGPVREAALRARDVWCPRLTPEDVEQLGFVAAVAARHQSNRGEMMLPSAPFLARLPLQRRLEVLCHVVQSATDTGTPSPAEAEALARRSLAAVPAGEELEEHLKLHGALGRLLAQEGQPREALEQQQRAAQGWVRHGRRGLRQLSYPLSEWFRLAGALEDGPAFALAVALWREASRKGGLGAMGELYVVFAQARALVWLGSSREAQASLARLWEDSLADIDFRLGAARWLCRCALASRDSESLAKIEGWLTEVGGKDGWREEVASIRDWIALDRAVWEKDADEARARTEALQSASPGLVTPILAWHAATSSGGASPPPVGPAVGVPLPQSLEAAAWLARWYPY